MTNPSTSIAPAIKAIQAITCRTPIDVPVRTSFGTMYDRPAVFVRLSDENGLHGYGEIWCNFPLVAAEHRQRLAMEIVAPVFLKLDLGDNNIYENLMARLHILALQSGEWGPLRQVAAGFDAALYDLNARRANLPLFRYLEKNSNGKLAAYASGIGPENPAEVAKTALENGHKAFKLKVGFGQETDLASLNAIRRTIGDTRLMIDANQGWNLQQALDCLALYEPFNLSWIEEPLPADRPDREWTTLKNNISIPIAAGENFTHLTQFHSPLSAKPLKYIQPDVAKWGGVSGCYEIAKTAASHGFTYCPHFLGGAIGLLTSAHILAALQGTYQGNGMLEMDINPNPLRDEMLGSSLRLNNGKIQLGDAPGIGITPDYLFESLA